MPGTLDKPIDPAMQAAIEDANVSIAAIADRNSLPASAMVLVLTGLLAMWAATAHDETKR
jgi:hypothetical protein